MRVVFVLFSAILGLVFIQGTAVAGDLAAFDLSLFGYRIGMSFDQASEVRPFTRVEDGPRFGGDTCGYIDHLWVEDIQFRLQVCFLENQVQKVIGRFSPALVEDLVARLKPVFGKGANESMLFQVPDGSQVSNRIQKWLFPGMQVVLVGTSRNTEFATLCLQTKHSTIHSEKVDPAAAKL